MSIPDHFSLLSNLLFYRFSSHWLMLPIFNFFFAVLPIIFLFLFCRLRHDKRVSVRLTVIIIINSSVLCVPSRPILSPMPCLPFSPPFASPLVQHVQQFSRGGAPSPFRGFFFRVIETAPGEPHTKPLWSFPCHSWNAAGNLGPCRPSFFLLVTFSHHPPFAASSTALASSLEQIAPLYPHHHHS